MVGWVLGVEDGFWRFLLCFRVLFQRGGFCGLFTSDTLIVPYAIIGESLVGWVVVRAQVAEVDMVLEKTRT